MPRVTRARALILALAPVLTALGLLAPWREARGAGAGGVSAPGPASASGQPPMRVLLIVDRPDDRFAGRIRAEISGLGMLVLTLEPWRTAEPVGPLEEAARAQQAVAAIRMVPSRNGVEVWMADRTTGRSLLRQLVVDESPGGPNEGLVALQTAELLRTSLLSAPPPPAPRPVVSPPPTAPAVPPPAVPPPPVVTAPASPAAAVKAGVQAGIGGFYAPGGTGGELQAWFSVHRSFGGRLGLAVDFSLPLGSATLSGPEGSTRMRTHLGGVVLLAHAHAPAAFYASGGVGAALVRVGFDGETDNPMLTARSTSLVTGAGYLRGDAGLEAASWLRVGVRAVAGAALRHAGVRLAGNEAATWGPLFAAAFAVLDVSWR
jgi:hypothetical protein